MTEAFLIFLFGCLGGILLELYRLYKIRQDKNSPSYYGQLKYWIITLGMIVCGGVLSWLWDMEVTLTPLLAVNIGITAPLLLSLLAGESPKETYLEHRVKDLEKTVLKLRNDYQYLAGKSTSWINFNMEGGVSSSTQTATIKGYLGEIK